MWTLVVGWWTAPAQAITLEEAFSAAEGAPELRASVAQADRAGASVGAARAVLLPKVALAARATWTDEEVAFDLGEVLPADVLGLIGGAPPPIVVQEQAWLDASAALLVPVVDADAWWTLRAADRAADAASLDVAAARRQLRVGVARAWYGTRMARDGVALAEEAVAVARTQEEVARRRVEAGDAPARVLLEAEQARLAAERDVSAATEQRIRAEQALHRWTGLPPDALLEGDAAPDALTAPPPDAAAAAATARADAAGQALTAARLGWAPDITARLTGSWTQNEGFAPNGTFVFAGLEASWTFDGGYRSSRVRDAGAAVVAAGAVAESAQRRLDEERETARAAVARAVAASASATRELAVADTRLREATEAFAQGLLPFSDLERAELAHRAAAVAASRERWAVSLATVELALAGG